ncbi:MAG: hypothetical protein GTN43_03280 [Candidatus Aenigmarchaeota archaeon]|nr:hypothetical protein [Candidatus Aenigmarchaeota archaeon]
MDWKEFFKPTKGKIVLFILIYLFAPLPYFVANPGCLMEIGAVCEPYWMFMPFVLIGLAFTSSGPSFSPLFITEFWSSLIMNLVIAYILSCIILSLYIKRKK